MALSADSPRDYGIGDISEHPVLASTKIYEGAAVVVDGNGWAKPLAVNLEFVGFAQRQADNSAGANGDKKVKVNRHGLIQLAVTGVDATKVGEAVYASDDNTFTLTKATGLPRIGKVLQHVSGTTCIVEFAASKLQTTIADPSGGATVDSQARTAINSIIDAMEAHGILFPA